MQYDLARDPSRRFHRQIAGPDTQGAVIREGTEMLYGLKATDVTTVGIAVVLLMAVRHSLDSYLHDALHG